MSKIVQCHYNRCRYPMPIHKMSIVNGRAYCSNDCFFAEQADKRQEEKEWNQTWKKDFRKKKIKIRFPNILISHNHVRVT